MTKKNKTQDQDRNNYVKQWKLDEDEQALVKEIEAWNFKSTGNLDKKRKQFEESAKETIKTRKKKITISLNQDDLKRIQEQAKIEWLPYQTFIGSILHKIASWTINHNN